MKMNKLAFNSYKCYFCSEAKEEENLIDMNTNSLVIDGELIDFADLALVVCLVEVCIIFWKSV